MKIVFTGGGTGGHFYPIIAIAERVNQIIDEENILKSELYFISDSPFDKELLFENNLAYEEIKTGKRRTHTSIKGVILNFFDLFKIFFGVVIAIFKLFSIYPDVVFGKGGYASFPTIFAARILRIPVVIHESDSVPGRVNRWAGSFAKRIAVSFVEAGHFFPKNKVAWTGQPIRTEIEHPANHSEALEYFKLESGLPVVLVLGGSLGAELINNAIIDALPRLVKNYQVLHQTGIRNFDMVKERADVVLTDDKNKLRYLPVAFLSTLPLKMAAGAATLIISRAGSMLFEIASWGVPSILVPIAKTNEDHQVKNAFNYARAGGCSVIEETNMTANILCGEIERIIEDKEIYDGMTQSAKAFNKTSAATKIARALVDIALSHEK